MAQANVTRTARKPATEMAKWSHGRFYWNELMTHDPERAKRFYQDTVGWRFEAMDMGDRTYWVAKVDDQPVGGIFEMHGPDFENVAEHWMSYLAVDDIDARVKTALAAGATVCRETFDVPTVGRIAILREPGGAMIGWMTPAS